MGYRVRLHGAAGTRELELELFNIRPGQKALDVFRPFDPQDPAHVARLQELGSYVAQGGPWTVTILDGTGAVVCEADGGELAHLVRPVAGELQEVLLLTGVRGIRWGGQV